MAQGRIGDLPPVDTRSEYHRGRSWYHQGRPAIVDPSRRVNDGSSTAVRDRRRRSTLQLDGNCSTPDEDEASSGAHDPRDTRVDLVLREPALPRGRGYGGPRRLRIRSRL